MTLLFFSWWKCKKTAPAFVLLLLLFCRCIFYIIFPFKKYRQGYHERVRVPTTHAYKKHATPDCYSQMRWHQHVMMCGAKNELFCFSWKVMTTCWEIRISALPNFSVKTSLSTCTEIISRLKFVRPSSLMTPEALLWRTKRVHYRHASFLLRRKSPFIFPSIKSSL